MNKKSAIATAGGLVASFAAGVAAVTFNWGLADSTAATTSTASPSPTKAPKVKPIIRHRTITVHKKAPTPNPVAVSGSSGWSGSSGSAPRTITLASNPVYSHSTPPVSTTGGSSAGGGGHGGGGGEGEGGD